MLAKITRGNQITIPKEIIKKAHLGASCPYVDIEYSNGQVHLKPVTIEEQIAPEQLEKFHKWALSDADKNHEYGSIDELVDHLKKRTKKP